MEDRLRSEAHVDVERMGLRDRERDSQRESFERS